MPSGSTGTAIGCKPRVAITESAICPHSGLVSCLHVALQGIIVARLPHTSSACVQMRACTGEVLVNLIGSMF